VLDHGGCRQLALLEWQADAKYRCGDRSQRGRHTQSCEQPASACSVQKPAQHTTLIGRKHIGFHVKRFGSIRANR
jgi:hypothetical protein